MPSLCLNMIVKNEEHIIGATLNNLTEKVKIDHWVIIDTGSTDDTNSIITDFFKSKKIPGKLICEKWVNFGYNRTKALQHARGCADFILIFDADDRIQGNMDLNLSQDIDIYKLKIGKDFEYYRPLIVNGNKKFEFKGVLHEFLVCNGSAIDCLKGDYFIQSNRLGSRSNDDKKYLKDARLLEESYEIENDIFLKCRYAFYCAQSYKDAGEIDRSIFWYAKVLSLNNWHQEKYCSCLYLGRLFIRKNNFNNAMFYFLKALDYDNKRIEAVAELTTLLRQQGLHEAVCIFYDRYKGYCLEGEKLFKEIPLYNKVLEFNFSISAFYANRKEEGKKILNELLNDSNLDKKIKEMCKRNAAFYK
jgi:glycosyltransferase involved in cell wall biosynthesis